MRPRRTEQVTVHAGRPPQGPRTGGRLVQVEIADHPVRAELEQISRSYRSPRCPGPILTRCQQSPHCWLVPRCSGRSLEAADGPNRKGYPQFFPYHRGHGEHAGSKESSRHGRDPDRGVGGIDGLPDPALGRHRTRHLAKRDRHSRGCGAGRLGDRTSDFRMAGRHPGANECGCGRSRALWGQLHRLRPRDIASARLRRRCRERCRRSVLLDRGPGDRG